jgi:hypothetical protein
MKFLLFIFFIAAYIPAYAQQGYPVPPAAPGRLFYIQHSDNHNTYVYDAVMEGRNLHKETPVDIYRILYAEDGRKAPLTAVQRRLAYGVAVSPLSANLFELRLAAAKKMKFFLTLDKAGKPVVYVIANNRKMYLERLFIKLHKEGGGLAVKSDYALFSGRDFASGKQVTEKVISGE